MACKKPTLVNLMLLLGMSITANASINNDTNVVTISAFSNTALPTMKIQDVSYVSDNINSQEFKMTLNTAEMMQLNQFKTHNEYSPGDTLYLLPVLKFDYCVDATDLAGGLDIKVNGAQFANNGDTINAYVQLTGNGAALSGSQHILFSYDDGANNTGLNSTNIKRLLLSSDTIPDGALSSSSFATTSALDGNTNLTAMTKVTGNSTSYTVLNHYHPADYNASASYTLTKSTATTRSDSAYVYDSTAITAGCGQSNGGGISVIVYASMADILQVPADDYTASITLGFEADGGA